MVQKGKRKQKKTSKSSAKNLLIRCGDLVYKLPLQSPISKSHERTLLELKDELEKIYCIYLNELSRRLKHSTFLLPSYESKEFAYRLDNARTLDLRSKVQKLLSSDCIKLIYNIFYMTIHKFLADIKNELSLFEERSKEFKIICIAESLNALESSAKELGKITETLKEHSEMEANCENITKLAFYEKVLCHYEDILIENTSGCRFPMIQNMINLLLELKKSNHSKSSFDSTSSSESYSDISHKSIEEIMSFIDGQDKQKVKAKASPEEINMKCLDEEIEKFTILLEAFQGTSSKLKPNLSSDWINNLRLQLKNNRT